MKDTEMVPIRKKEKGRDQMKGGKKKKMSKRWMGGREEARQHVCNIFECVYVCVTG